MYLLPAEVLFWEAAISIVLCVILFGAGVLAYRHCVSTKSKVIVFIVAWVLIWHVAIRMARHAELVGSSLTDLFGSGIKFALPLIGLWIPALAMFLFRKKIGQSGWTPSRPLWLILFAAPALFCTLLMANTYQNHKRTPDDDASIALIRTLQRVESGETIILPTLADGSAPLRKSINESLELRKTFCNIEDAATLHPVERFRHSPSTTLFNKTRSSSESQAHGWTRLITGYESCWFIATATFERGPDGNMVLGTFDLSRHAKNRNELIADNSRLFRRTMVYPKQQSSIFGPLL